MKYLLCWLCVSFPLVATAFDYEPTLKSFFELYDVGLKNSAVELVYLTNRDRNRPENVEQMAQKQVEINELTQGLGSYYGFELLGRHNVGNRLKHFTYMLYHEGGPVRMEFEYYKPHKHWLLMDLQIDVNLGDELKALARKDIAGFLVKDDIVGSLKNNTHSKTVKASN